MLLNTQEHQLKYIAVDPGTWYWSGRPQRQKHTFEDFVRIVNFGQVESGFESYCYWAMSPAKSDCVFLGTPSDIDNEIQSKLSTVNPSNFKKLFFDPLCKYPRFKLNSLTNIKRCLSPSKADAVVISKHDLSQYEVEVKVQHGKKSKDILVFYSPTSRCYYFVDYYPNGLGSNAETKQLAGFIQQYSTDNTTNLHSWASALINKGIMPKDCSIFYFGPVILTNTKNTVFIKNLYSNYMKLIYDTELDKFINNGLQKPTDEDLDTLNRMIASTDESVVGMGLKLLSNYDLQDYVCTISIMLAQNWQKVHASSVSKSVGFEQVLTTLNINKNILGSYNIDRTINELYSKSNNSKDKEVARKIVIARLTKELQRNWENQVKQFNNLNLSFNFTIE